ncbi:MAG: PaaI family thioesterase [bacterium]
MEKSEIKRYLSASFIKELGIKLTEIKEEEAFAEMVVTEKMQNYMDYLHGGVIASLIDTIAFFPNKLLPSGRKITTTGIEVKYFRPVKVGDVLKAHAKIVHLGKKIGVIEVAVVNAARKLIAKGTVSVMTINI